MVWSHNDTWMMTGDHGGYVKYWQSNMNNVKSFQAHKEPVRGIRYRFFAHFLLLLRVLWSLKSILIAKIIMTIKTISHSFLLIGLGYTICTQK